MRRVILSFSSPLLAIFIASLLLSSCKQTTPQQTTQTPKEQSQSTRGENPVFAQWRDMRARRVPEDTKVHWRLYVWCPLSESLMCWLEGYRDYPVSCSRRTASGYVFNVAANDWVEVVGTYLGVTDIGEVALGLEELTNLGPGY